MSRKNYSIVIIQILAALVLLTGEYVNPAIAYAAGLMIVVLGIGILRVADRREISLLLPLVGLLAVGAIVSFSKLFPWDRDFIYLYGKDLWYYSKPVLLLMAGFYLFRFSIGFDRLVSILIFCSLAITIASISKLLINVDFNNMDLDEIRFRFGSGNILPAISLAYILHVKSFKPRIFGIVIPRGLVIVTLLSGLLMAFSRTIWGVFIIMLLAFNSYFTLKIRKALPSLFKLGVVVLSFVILLIILNYRNDESTVLGQFIAKYSRSMEEISKESEFSTYKDKMTHWRGYESLLVRNEIGNNSLVGKIFGYGFGKTVYIGEDHFLGPENIYIPKFHNGYSEIRLKTGLTGMLLYFFFFLGVFLLADSDKIRSIGSDFLKGLVVTALFTTIIITGYYNKSVLDPVVLITGFLISSLLEKRGQIVINSSLEKQLNES